MAVQIPIPKPDTSLVRRARKMDRILAETYPDAAAELDFTNPFECLVVTVVSAQTTDRRVNAASPALFAAYPTPEAMAAAPREHMEQLLGPLGFFRQKTDSLLKLSQALVDTFDGEVPDRLEDRDADVAGLGLHRLHHGLHAIPDDHRLDLHHIRSPPSDHEKSPTSRRAREERRRCLRRDRRRPRLRPP